MPEKMKDWDIAKLIVDLIISKMSKDISLKESVRLLILAKIQLEGLVR